MSNGMLKAILIGTCASALLAGCATQGPPRQSASAVGPGCVSDTGSRLARSQPPCSTPGRAYSGDDLQRTGEINVGDALQKLDPAVTVQHH